MQRTSRPPIPKPCCPRYLAWLVVGLAFSLSVLGNTGVAAAQTGVSTQPCAADLDHCPPRGCAAADTAAALVNERKRSFPPVGAPIHLTLDDFDLLQTQAGQLVGQNVALNTTARNKLKNLNTLAGKVSEGDLVQVTGFVVGLEDHLPRANSSGESVNCQIHGKVANDFHIPIADPTTSFPRAAGSAFTSGSRPTWIERSNCSTFRTKLPPNTLPRKGSHLPIEAHPPPTSWTNPYWLAMKRCSHWSLSSAIHLSKTNWSCGSILVKKIPIPAFDRAEVTLPRASKFSFLWEISILTFVSGGNGFSVSTWHPNRLRSLVCSLV